MLKSAKEDLKRSGISVEEAEYAEMFSVKDASTVHEDFKPLPALIIPYVNPWTDDFIEYQKHGENHQFLRVRYLGDLDAPGGFKKKKPPRYSQPKESGIHPYFPITENIDWEEVKNDIDTPIMITEGEKKALAGCLAGIPTIGLGGVYNFASDGHLLPLLESMGFEGRTVYICYDSDAKDNGKIQLAEGRLATELSIKQGANVFMVRLPQKATEKVGLDDYLIAEGDDALFELLDKAPQMRPIDKEVLRLNESVCWVETEGLVLDMEADIWLKKGDFIKGSKYSTRIIQTMTAQDKMINISVPDSWLTHPHARRYTDTIFKPGTEDKAIPLPKGGVAYNRFRGLSGIEGDVAPFFTLYEYIMSNTDEFDFDLVWKTICYKVQNWEENIGIGLIMTGDPGGGKTLFCDILRGIAAPYDKVLATNELGDNYNEWIETSLIVVMNEAESADLQRTMNTLRTFITDTRQSLHEKYRTRRQVDSHAFYIFNGNERKAAAFEDKERRFIVLATPRTHPKGDEFYGPIFDWYRNNGSKKLLNYFENYDLKGWTPPRHAPITREKRMQYYASLTPLQKIADDIKHADENVVFTWLKGADNWANSDAAGVTPAETALAAQIQSQLGILKIRPFYTPEELSMIFPSLVRSASYGKMSDTTPANKITQELLQAGVGYLKCKENMNGFKHGGTIKQYLVVADAERYEKPISQNHFDKLMKGFPTYSQVRKIKKANLIEKNRESKRNKK